MKKPIRCLVLGAGANAVRPRSIAGIDSKHVFVMKTVPDVAALTAYTKANEVKDVAVVGGGYIVLKSLRT